ncbi:MAG TPA: c-type cytochrome, partial [Gaiellaceae bacterium]
MKERRTGAVVAVGGAVALLALAAVGIVAFAAGRGGEKTTTVTVAGAPAQGAAQTASVSPAVAAGAHDFVQFACAQCHGELGRGGVSKFVPALTAAGKTLTPAELRKIIDHGLGVSADPARPYMPVWGEVVSTTQVNDLVAYIRAGLPAVADATPVPVPTGQGDAVAGAALYQRYGCVNCHGPNGLGGVPNPQSPDKAIPPLSGKTFRGEFDTEAKIAEVIRSGSVIGRAPIVSMPHWGGILSDAQIRA